MLTIQEHVFEKLDGYDPIKINNQLYVIKHSHQIDDNHAKFQLITTDHSGTMLLGGHYDAIVDVEILGIAAFADFVMGNDFSELITLLEDDDYPRFLQNTINFGRLFDNAQYQVIQVAADKVLTELTQLARH